MKTLIAALLLALTGSASAASVAMKPPVGITGNPASATGWTTAANFVGNFSAASFSGGFTTNVGGKAVTMPATMRMAANAGQFAATAVRLNPTALLGAAVVAWLADAGLRWLNGQWEKLDNSPVPGAGFWVNIGQTCIASAPCNYGAAVDAALALLRQGNPRGSGYTVVSSTVVESSKRVDLVVSYYDSGFPGQQFQTTTFLNYGGQSSPAPATEADFAPLATAPLPDEVANELAPKGVALPMENPQFNPPYVDEPLGDPYEDPVTGKRYRDNARVTPQSDGKTADVQTTKQEVDEAGEPVTDPATGIEKPPEKQDDFCKQNPDSLACIEKGETDELDLETRSIGSMVSPVAVGGAGHCMADKTLAMATMGRSITFTYKPICDLASMVRPLILALAWLLAGWIMIGAVKEN